MKFDIVRETNQYRYIRNYINGIAAIYVQDKFTDNRIYISGESLARFSGYKTLESMFMDDNVLDRLNDRWRVEGFFPIIIIDETTLLSD
jgi:hypothetical protein